MATKLGIRSMEMGPREDAEDAFEGQQIPTTPFIEKLHMHVQDYVDQEDFYVSPLKHADVSSSMNYLYANYIAIS